MKNLIETYTKEFSSRFTSRQKKKFVHHLEKEMEVLDYTSTIIDGKSGLSHAHNVLFGNLKNAKIVIAVPYDTPQKSIWFQSKYYPLNGNRSNLASMLSLYLPSMIVYITALIMIYLQDSLFTTPVSKAIFTGVLIAVLVSIMYYLMHGLPNKHNDARNSASIVAALKFASLLSKDEKRKVAFLFFDKNVNKHIGAMVAVKEFMKMGKNPYIIQLNCIGRGDTMMIGYNPSARKLAQELNRTLKEKLKQVNMDDKMRLQSAMDHFQKAVTISAGEVDSKGDLVVYHTGTGKDIGMDEANIDKVVGMLKKYSATL